MRRSEGGASVDDLTEGVLPTVHHVQETVLVLVGVVDRAHERGCRGKRVVNEDEDGTLGAELDPLPDHIRELAYGEIRGDEKLLLVDFLNGRLLDLLNDNRDPVRVLGTNSRRLGLALLELVLRLERACCYYRRSLCSAGRSTGSQYHGCKIVCHCCRL